MKSQKQIDYERIERAIAFLMDNYKNQPSLQEVAEALDLGPHHFQRLFKEWVGVSPKKFIQYLSLDYAKERLKREVPLIQVADEVGLSGTGRLHDLFVSIEGMTPGEFKDGGRGLAINYQLSDSPFGSVFVASTQKGVCALFFCEHEEEGLRELREIFPKAQFQKKSDHLQQAALAIFNKDWQKPSEIKLHLAGTSFQLKVWEMLLKIPEGELRTYKEVAQALEQENSSRAVGTAIGKNPIGFIIPCHRVIRGSGLLGGYRWGLARKASIIGWEAAKEK